MPSLDLDAIRPPDSDFTHRGHRWFIPCELAVETIVEALQLRQKFEEAEKADNEDEMVRAMEALRGIVWSLVDECADANAPTREAAGAPYPRLSIEEITAVLTLAMGGAEGETPEQVAKRALEGPEEEGGAPGEAGDPTRSSGSSGEAPATALEVEPAAI